MPPRLLAALAALSLILASSMAQASPDRMLDPLTLSPQARAVAFRAPLGHYGPFGEPAAPGCTWSRIWVPTFQGVRWMLLEMCSGLGTQAH